MKIALDAMGGDLAPKATVEGAVLAARDFKVEVVLVGDRDILASELAEHRIGGLAITIEHAPEHVGMDESPLVSALGKPQSSIHVGLEMVKRGEASAFVSAGNSGAVMAAAMMILGTLPGVDRPAIASPFPASDGLAILIDAGANTEVKPVNLVQFAIMGSVYASRVRNVSNPRVGILSNGEEDSKGSDLTRGAAAMLRAMPGAVNYIGYVEGRDINRAKADVVVTDGFTGNVTLKTMEGFAAFLMSNLREILTVGRGRLAYLMIRKRLATLRERLDPSEYGGAPLLGLNGIAIIAHGSSNPRAIRNAVRAAANEALVEQVNAEIVELIGRSPDQIPSKTTDKGLRALFSRMRDRLHRHGIQPREADKSARSTGSLQDKLPERMRPKEHDSPEQHQTPKTTPEQVTVPEEHHLADESVIILHTPSTNGIAPGNTDQVHPANREAADSGLENDRAPNTPPTPPKVEP